MLVVTSKKYPNLHFEHLLVTASQALQSVAHISALGEETRFLVKKNVTDIEYQPLHSESQWTLILIWRI